MSHSRRVLGRSPRVRRRRAVAIAVLLVLVVAGAGAFAYLSQSDDEGSLSADAAGQGRLDAEEGDSPFGDALAATQDAGDAEVVARLNVRMPRDLDDGVPKRRIDGSGVATADLSSARVDYEMSDVPNSAGYFGHVDGELAVGYSGAEMLISFPILDETVLAERGSWFSYDLPFLSSDHLLDLGVGQLRELALSDPRIGIALLNGVEGAAEPSEEVDPDESPDPADVGGDESPDSADVGGDESPDEADVGGDESPDEADVGGEESPDEAEPGGDDSFTRYEVEAGTVEAGEAVPELDPLFTEMAEGLGLTRIPITVSIDEDGRIRRLEYRMVFVANKGPGKVRLAVRLDLTDFGVDEPELPAEDEIVSYEDYFSDL